MHKVNLEVEANLTKPSLGSRTIFAAEHIWRSSLQHKAEHWFPFLGCTRPFLRVKAVFKGRRLWNNKGKKEEKGSE